jgi:hypothetical protein
MSHYTYWAIPVSIINESWNECLCISLGSVCGTPELSTHSSPGISAGCLQTIHVMCFLPEPLHQRGKLRAVLNEANSFCPTTNCVFFFWLFTNFGRAWINIRKKFDTATIWVVCKWREDRPLGYLSLWTSRRGQSGIIIKGRQSNNNSLSHWTVFSILRI